MLISISKYYAKKKRKKTGVHQKLIKQKAKSKKKLIDKNGNNNTINTINNINNKNNNNNAMNKKNNLNKIQSKKITNIRNTSLNNSNNNQNLKTIGINKYEKKKVLNISSLDNKPILKMSGFTHQFPTKEETNRINSKNNIKCVKFEDDKNISNINQKNNSAKKENNIKKNKFNSIVVNDLKNIKPEHTLIIHNIDYEFVNSSEFKNVVKACGLLNNEK